MVDRVLVRGLFYLCVLIIRVKMAALALRHSFLKCIVVHLVHWLTDLNGVVVTASEPLVRLEAALATLVLEHGT